jgi:decaprenylphospho-beta-D-erythro-pentofuranosid-2-ulose 2-reductase
MKRTSIKKIVVLGATSGIAQPLLRMMARDGKELLLVARSQERLDAVRTDLLARGAANVLTFEADLVTSQELVVSFAKECFPDFDTLLLTYGTMLDQVLCQTSVDYAVRELETNLVSAVALLTRFVQYFEVRNGGTIAVITSVAGDRGRRSNYVYGAAKGGLSIFLQGLRARMHKSGVRVLTIKPGPVETAMTVGRKLPMLASPESVAEDIYRALKRQDNLVYAPARWRWIMAGVRIIPERVFKRLSI